MTSKHGAVTIGEGCIISERSIVGLLSPSSTSSGEEEVILEAGVSIEVGARVEASRVGEGSVVGVNARVGKGVVLGKVCYVCM